MNDDQKINAKILVEIYKIIFGTNQFPIWLIVQYFYQSIIISQLFRKYKTKTLRILLSFFGSLICSFFPREIIGVVYHLPSPTLKHPLSVLIFLACFGLTQFLEIFRRYNIIGGAFGFLQALNQVRLFTLVLRIIDSSNEINLMFIALFYSILDHLIAMILGLIIKGKSNKTLSLEFLILKMLFSVIYWFCVHAVHSSVISSALIFCSVLGIINCVLLLLEFSSITYSRKMKKI